MAILQVPIWREVTDEDRSVTDAASAPCASARTTMCGATDGLALRLAEAGFQSLSILPARLDSRA